MSIQIVEISLPSVIDTVTVETPSTIAIVEIRQGPAGEGGGGAAVWGSIGGTLSSQTDLQTALNLKAPLASPALTGTPTAPTAATTTSTTQLANTAFVQQELASGVAVAKNLEFLATNKTAALITKGSIVYVSGATGNKPEITLAQANNDANSAQTIGFAKTDIAVNGTGFVIVRGELEQVRTFGATAGQQLYLSPTTAGAFTTTKPSAPQHLVYVGIVIEPSTGVAANGIILVAIQNGYELNELHDVAAPTPSAGQFLKRNAENTLWVNSGIVSADITDATSSATPNTVVKRNGEGGALFTGGEFEPYAVVASGSSNNGLYAGSGDAVGLVAYGGTAHARFGNNDGLADGSSYVASLDGAFGWIRGAFTGEISAAATLTGNHFYILPDASGTVALIEDINAENVSAVFATEDTAPADADQLAVVSPAGGWLSLSRLWDFVKAKLDTAGLVIAGSKSFSGQISMTNQTAANATSAMTRGLSDSRYGGPVIAKVSTAQINSTTTTLVDATGLTDYILEANTWYQLDFAGRVTTTTGASWSIELLSNQALDQVAASMGTAATSTVQIPFLWTTTRLILLQRAATGTSLANFATVIFRTGAIAPTCRIGFSQWANPAGTASLLTNAVCVIKKLPIP